MDCQKSTERETSFSYPALHDQILKSWKFSTLIVPNSRPEIHEFCYCLTFTTDLHLAGNVKTSDLTSEQVTRVIKYVNKMLLRFKEADDAALRGDTLQSDYPEQQGSLVQCPCDSVYLPIIYFLDSSSYPL